MNTLFKTLALSLLLLPSYLFAASAAPISIQPENPIQGDPIFVSVVGTSTAKGIWFGSKQLGVFSYQGRPSAIYGFDINKKPGVYKVTAKLSDGSMVEKSVLVESRKKEEVTFSIPAKLGGNTAASQTKLVSTLADENAGLVGFRTGTHAFWTGAFSYPVASPVVTDPYGYTRATGAATVLHKGTDFRAAEGTPVLAINRGVVRLVRETRNYGKTVVVDHGLGLMSFYMHLSRIEVEEGQLVQKGERIGLSGKTGYAESPHLHLTIRQGDVSIDPIVFYSFFR